MWRYHWSWCTFLRRWPSTSHSLRGRRDLSFCRNIDKERKLLIITTYIHKYCTSSVVHHSLQRASYTHDCHIGSYYEFEEESQWNGTERFQCRVGSVLKLFYCNALFYRILLSLLISTSASPICICFGSPSGSQSPQTISLTFETPLITICPK